MSEEQMITKVEKEKDPRMVEAGRRLGAISRAAKEKKARQRSEAERQHMEHARGEPTEGACEEVYSMITVLTGVGVLTGLVCLYFTYKQDKRAQTTDESKQQPQQPTPSSGSKLRSLDD